MNLLKDRHGEGDDGCAHAAHRSAGAPDALAAAEAACLSRGARLTPIRRDVLGVLYSTHRPLGAYDIADALAGQGRRRLAPITIYRAPEVLMGEGLVHRLADHHLPGARVPHGRGTGASAREPQRVCRLPAPARAAGPRRVPDLRGLRRRRRDVLGAARAGAVRPPRGRALRAASAGARDLRPLRALPRAGAGGGRGVSALSCLPQAAAPAPRQPSVAVRVGSVVVGGGAPIVVQSMTNTDTADVDATVAQVAALARAGSEIVRITVDRDAAAAAVPVIRERLDRAGVDVPLVGDFHYIGHKLLADHPACAAALQKYRINPGNVGFKDKKDRQFAAIVELAIRHGKAVRIGANWGSLDQELLTRLMDENAGQAAPLDTRAVTREAMVSSALLSTERAEAIGLARDRIVLSAKVSAVQDLIAVYRELARRSDYALHLGLTEAGMGSKGIVASSAAIGILLQEGIGDTIRYSLTPEPGGDRTLEVKAAQELLQTMGFRSFVPLVAACPGCGRTTSTVFQELARDIEAWIAASMPQWRRTYPGVETLNVAVMVCIVNGPGESKHADIGISLPGTGETPSAPVFIDGQKAMTLRGPAIAAEFKTLVAEYIDRRYGETARVAAE